MDELALPSVDEVGRRIDSEQLVGAAEIASRLGVKRPQVVHDWRRRYEDFPEPVAHLRQALVWYWPDVDRWARATGRLGHSRDTRGPESAGTSGN